MFIYPPPPPDDGNLIQLVVICDLLLVGKVIYNNAVIRALVEYLRVQLLRGEYQSCICYNPCSLPVRSRLEQNLDVRGIGQLVVVEDVVVVRVRRRVKVYDHVAVEHARCLLERER